MFDAYLLLTATGASGGELSGSGLGVLCCLRDFLEGLAAFCLVEGLGRGQRERVASAAAAGPWGGGCATGWAGAAC